MTLIIISCGSSHDGKEEDAATECAENFARAFYNLQYKESLDYTTPESERFVRYQAAIITEKDVETVRNADEGATISIESFDWESPDADTSAIISIQVENFLKLDSIQSLGHIEEKEAQQLRVVKRDGKWRVDLER